MPYIDGQTLRRRLEQEVMLPLPAVAAWGAEIADALAYAHAHGIIHRDIKPENLLIHADHVLIADFGIARGLGEATAEGQTDEQLILGTRAYMSPEQATGSVNLDGRSDIYSLGCVVYEMLTGEPPFGGTTAQAVTAKKLAGRFSRARLVRPTTPARMERALAKALAPLAPDRYRSADEFAGDLRRVTAPRPWLVVGLAVLFASIATVAVFLFHSPGQAVTATGRRRVVVGTFENRTGDSANDAFGIMAADWITEGLQRTGAVDVVPTATALAASRLAQRGAAGADPIRILARETGAGLVVVGSLYRDRDSLILQAQLADANSGKLVGAVEPLRTTAESSIDALQSLRNRLMGLLAISLDNRVQEAERPPTFEAYQAFAQGLEAYVRSDDSAAVVRFEAAHQLDSTFVLPILYASFCRSNLGDFPGADSLLKVVAPYRDRLSEYDRAWMDFRVAQLAGRDEQALAAIRRAAELAPTSKATYNFAVQAYEARQPFPAESALRSLSPDVGPMRGWLPYWTVLSMVLHVQGKHSQELEVATQARKRFPGAIAPYIAQARGLAATGRGRDLDQLWEEALRVAEPPPREAGSLALEAGMELVAHGTAGQARRWFARALEAFTPVEGASDTTSMEWGRARALAGLGRWPDADTLSERLTMQDSTREAYWGMRGLAALHTGDRAGAYAILRRLASDHRPYLYGNAQFLAARIAAAAGDTLRASRLLTSAFTQGYPYDIDFHRDDALGGLAGSSIVRQMSAR
jgi:TolB-like protein